MCKTRETPMLALVTPMLRRPMLCCKIKKKLNSDITVNIMRIFVVSMKTTNDYD